ncbi:MAG TPA: DUF1800 family protein [Opitutaceae bacterium]|nr:DUF1800 family protein [Opitutaceae bacterium]
MKTLRLRAVRCLFAVAILSPLHAAQYDQRLGALSTRALVGTGDNVMITGFNIGPGAPKKVLIRGLGPRLTTSPYSISTGTLANPLLQVYDGTGTKVLENDDWSTDDSANIVSTTAAVGLVSLTNNSRDAAIVATLSPGSYTVHVRGSPNSNGNGIALLEVYDVSGAARLMALSTRALVGTGANILIPGLSVAPSPGARRVLIRAAGPGLATLPGFSSSTPVVPDPVLAVLSGGSTIASNNDWDANNANAGGQLSNAFAQGGSFPFAAGSKDAAVVVDLQPGGYTIQVGSNNNGPTGLALVEIYDLTPEKMSSIGVTATVATTDTTGSAPGVFQLTRIGDASAAITVTYSMGGTAVSGVDYEPLPGSVVFPAGVTSLTIPITARANAQNLNNRTAILTLSANPAGYGISNNDHASVTIFYNPGTLFVSNLRAAPGVSGTTAFGTATLQLSPDEQSAFVNVSFSNLSGPETVAYLYIDGNYVLQLPQGQVTGTKWNFSPTGLYGTADLLAALKGGRVYVGIGTSNNPSNELTGTLVRSTGSAAFNVPPPPPAMNLGTVSQPDAARFLQQATFGPSKADIDALVAKGYTAWLAEQFAAPPTLQRVATMADFAANDTVGGQGNRDMVTNVYQYPGGSHRQAAWWKTALTAPDQLRQRMAFALSEILVISDQNGTISAWQEGAANYHDILVRGAFGNFRTVLEEVTLSPMMGIYLSSLRNGKATATTLADENYAREIMQLFTIGLNELQPDGTLKLDPSGQPIATYSQATITEMAKVFTGWSYFSTAATPNFRGGASDYINPMMIYPAFHDTTQKTIIGGKILPAGQDGPKDLKDALDALFNHPNTGPFICRQLIQRLVTSNPSPGYVYRVAEVFANNGAGVRGDLGAVARAILTDYEARSPAFPNTAAYGKLKEPILRLTALLRAFGGASNSGRFTISNPENSLAQAALRAPTVFNFFEPDYVLAGDLAAAGLYAPEYQILTDTTAISMPNFYYTYIYNNRSTTDPAQQTIGLTLDAFVPYAKTPLALIDQLNLILCGYSIPPAMATRLVAALNAMPTNSTANDTERVRAAIYLIITSPEGAVQK